MSEEQKIPIAIPVETNADEAAASLESLRERIAGGTESLKEMAGAMRRLKGSSDEVKAAKDSLKSKIEQERNAISQAQLAIQKAGTSLEKLSKQTKEQPKFGLAGTLATSGNPVKVLREKFDGLKATVSDSKTHLKLLGQAADGLASKTASLASGGLSLAKTAVLGLVAACVAVTVAAAASGIGFAKFVLGAANAARTAGLMREAAYGGQQNAEALGTQVDALARKVHTSKNALNELAVSLSMAGVQGQTLVDTFNAIGQAQAAVGDSAASKLRELVERGRLTQRFVVNPLELQGSGLKFEELAQALATQMRVGVAQARKALVEGRVPLGDGAKALRKAVEDKFGGINLRRMSDLTVVFEKAKERLAALTTGVNLEKLAGPLASLLALIDDEKSVSGAALKQLVTFFGNGLVSGITKSAPFVEKFFKGMIIGGLDLLILFLRLRNRLEDTFGGSKILRDVDGLKLAMNAGKFAVVGLAVGIGAVVGALAIVGAVIGGSTLAIMSGIDLVSSTVKGLVTDIKNIDFVATGAAIIDGLVDGLKSGVTKLETAVGSLTDRIKKRFTGDLQIRSPSNVTRGYGRNTAKGYEEGVDAGAGDAEAAVARMIGMPKGGGASGGAGGAKSVTFAPQVSVTIGGGGGDAEALAKEVAESVRREMQALFDEMLAELGIPRAAPTFPVVPAT